MECAALWYPCSVPDDPAGPRSSSGRRCARATAHRWAGPGCRVSHRRGCAPAFRSGCCGRRHVWRGAARKPAITRTAAVQETPPLSVCGGCGSGSSRRMPVGSACLARSWPSWSMCGCSSRPGGCWSWTRTTWGSWSRAGSGGRRTRSGGRGFGRCWVWRPMRSWGSGGPGAARLLWWGVDRQQFIRTGLGAGAGLVRPARPRSLICFPLRRRMSRQRWERSMSRRCAWPRRSSRAGTRATAVV